MSLERSELLVLRRIKLRDTSLMLTVLTPEFGKLSLVARAASRPGSALAEALQYFTVAEAQFYHREQQGVDYVSKAEAIESFENIHKEADRFGHGSAGLEFANLYLPEGEVNSEVYDLLKRYLRLLNLSPARDLERELLHFWLRLTILAGYEPQLDRCQCGKPITGERVAISPAVGGIVCSDCREAVGSQQFVQMGTLQVLRRLTTTSIEARGKVSPTVAQMREIRDLLTALTEYHVGRRAALRSFDFLRKLNRSETSGGSSGEQDT